MKKLLMMLLNLYQRYLAPINFGYHTCKFTPSCSEYTKQAINKYGVLQGIWKGIKRVVRCQPFSQGGYDPVE